MKLIFIFIFFGISIHLHAENILLRSIGNREISVQYHIPREELEKVPAWDPTEGEPAPLTRDQAVEIAKKASKDQALPISDISRIVVSLEKIHQNYLAETRDQPIQGCIWFYLVKVTGGTEKLCGENEYIVSMSGAMASRNSKQRH